MYEASVWAKSRVESHYSKFHLRGKGLVPQRSEQLPSEQKESGKDNLRSDKENPKLEESRHVRRSEWVRKQRYDIQPEEIGDDDDKTDQDYK